MTVTVVGAAILYDGRVLAARRTPPRAGWELPGGKVEPGESAEAAVVREIAEELACTVEVTGWLAGESPVREGLVLRVALARLVAGEPLPSEHDVVLVARRRPARRRRLAGRRPTVPPRAAEGAPHRRLTVGPGRRQARASASRIRAHRRFSRLFANVGSSSTSRRNTGCGTTSVVSWSTASTLADRGLPSIMLISPK